MSLSFFIARRIYGEGGASGKLSQPAVRVAMAGVAVGLAVMLAAVSVIRGFKGEVRDKVAGFGSHIQVTNLDASYASGMRPLAVSDSLLAALSRREGVRHAQRYSIKAGMIKTDSAFQGMLLKGVGEEYDMDFFRRHLVEGEMPAFRSTESSGRVLVSRSLAGKLKLKPGGKIDTYYIQDGIRARRLQVAGIFQTNFPEFDDLYLLTDLCLVNRLNKWEPGLAGGIEIALDDYSALEDATASLADTLAPLRDRLGARFCVQNVEQLNPQVFAWLGVLDVNIWVILILMAGVAGFTMVSGLLILIIERAPMIGVLKSLGAGNGLIRRVFLWLSVFLIGKGMLWGNALGLAFYGVQRCFSPFKLDAGTYYMDTVPVSFGLWWFALLNAGTLIVSVLMLVGASCLVARIRPADSIRYE